VSWWFTLPPFLSLDQDVTLESGAGLNQGDQVGASDRAPVLLGGLDQLIHHGEGRGWAAGAASEETEVTAP
jgi:hypothetical protein